MQYNLAVAIQPFQDYEAHQYLQEDLHRLAIIIHEQQDMELESLVNQLIYDSLLLSRDLTTKQEQDDFKELHTHINVLDSISDRINNRSHRLVDYTCYWSPKSEHTFCQHSHCIYDEDWMKREGKKIVLRNRIKEEEKYLNEGEGTVNFDKKDVYKNILKMKKELESIK